MRVPNSVEEQALAVNETFVESALHELQKIGDELASIKRYYKDASAEARTVERERFPALAAMLTRRMFRALCAAYVRRLDMDDAIRAGDVKPNASDADTKSAPSRSRGYAGIANGDYVSAVDSSEDTISESEGGDA